MKTQIELIAHYSKEFTKVVTTHGAESDYATMAFFKLQAAKMSKSVEEIGEWSTQEFDRLKEITLESV